MQWRREGWGEHNPVSDIFNKGTLRIESFSYEKIYSPLKPSNLIWPFYVISITIPQRNFLKPVFEEVNSAVLKFTILHIMMSVQDVCQKFSNKIEFLFPFILRKEVLDVDIPDGLL